MTTLPCWDPLTLCEMGAGPRGDGSFCCGITIHGTPCKNTIRMKELKTGRDDLKRLSFYLFDSSDLQPLLCSIAKSFLCIRWHQARQAESLGKQWYDTAMRNYAIWALSPADPQPLLPVSSLHSIGSEPAPDTSLLDGDGPLHSAENEAVEVSSIETSIVTEESQTTEPYVSTTMVRADYVPRDVPPTQPAIPPCAGDIRAGDIRASVRQLQIASVSLSDEVSEIYCMFCLAEDGDQADECVVLRCNECTSLAHLGCVKEWLENRNLGLDQSCCVCRRRGTLDALVCSPRVPLASGASEGSFTASVDENTLGPVYPDISSLIDGQQSEPVVTRQSSRRLMDQAVRQGTRRSARLVIPPHHTRGEPRRSERLAGQRRG